MSLISTYIRPRHQLRTDAYLTDGFRLFRVQGVVGDPWLDGWALLEDCLTLRADFYSGDELRGMDLRAVTPRP